VYAKCVSYGCLLRVFFYIFNRSKGKIVESRIFRSVDLKVRKLLLLRNTSNQVFIVKFRN